jgi:hypothetical protein
MQEKLLNKIIEVTVERIKFINEHGLGGEGLLDLHVKRHLSSINKTAWNMLTGVYTVDGIKMASKEEMEEFIRAWKLR